MCLCICICLRVCANICGIHSLIETAERAAVCLICFSPRLPLLLFHSSALLLILRSLLLILLLLLVVLLLWHGFYDGCAIVFLGRIESRCPSASFKFPLSDWIPVVPVAFATLGILLIALLLSSCAPPLSFAQHMCFRAMIESLFSFFAAPFSPIYRWSVEHEFVLGWEGTFLVITVSLHIDAYIYIYHYSIVFDKYMCLYIHIYSVLSDINKFYSCDWMFI